MAQPQRLHQTGYNINKELRHQKQVNSMTRDTATPIYIV